MPGTRVTLLGGFSLVEAGAEVPVPYVAQRVVAFLAIYRRPLLRTFMAGSLWADSSDERASASLRTTLWKLRRTGLPIVRTTVDQVWLDPDVGVDLADATEFAHGILSGDGVGDWMSRAVYLERDLLPDWYDEWLAMEREQFRQLRLHALERLSSRLVEQGSLPAAVEVGLAAVAADPLRESSRRALIQAHLAEGNMHEAMREYGRFRRLLRDELNAAPSPAMEALVRRVDPRRMGDGALTRH